MSVIFLEKNKKNTVSLSSAEFAKAMMCSAEFCTYLDHVFFVVVFNFKQNMLIFFPVCPQKHVMGIYWNWNCLKAIPSTHNIYFHGEIRKIFTVKFHYCNHLKLRPLH